MIRPPCFCVSRITEVLAVWPQFFLRNNNKNSAETSFWELHNNFNVVLPRLQRFKSRLAVASVRRVRWFHHFLPPPSFSSTTYFSRWWGIKQPVLKVPYVH